MRALNDIRKEGLEALTNKLGPADMIRFLHMYDPGSGDFTKERQKLANKLTVEDLRKQFSKKK